VTIDFEVEAPNNSIRCRAHVETLGQTGVEIEALCATQIALLTIYDMCKAVDRGMTISDIRLLEKSGGKSGTWERIE
jgi:cyclic pyranopterin phosphate synthase